jgi:hypothetical protein
MRKQKVSKFWISAFLMVFAVVMSGCGDEKNAGAGNPSDPLTPPTVTSVTPPDTSTGVCPSTANITATFSKAMNQNTINTSTFTLTGPSAASVPGTVSLDSTGLIATFAPSSALTVNTAYTATVTTGVADKFGFNLAANKVWTFTTATTACPGPIAFVTPACGFGILAGTTVTNVAGTATTVSGDVGVWPGTAITGFGPPASITGTQYTGPGPGVAMTAQGQLTTAYNAAASAAAGGTILTADIGGQTLPPGAYRTTSAQPTLGITGTLTLNGQGDPNAVFIIHVESALTTASSSKVLLIGGAQAKNVIWQIGSSATLGTNSVFTGNILALSSITVTTGTTLNGRALARNGAVTLDTNTVVVPPC